jgi:hypothetical protein
VVQASAVGYRPARAAAHAPAEIEVILTPDQLSRRESIEVSAGAFEATTVSSPSERTLTGPELKNLAGVLADDPLRAVQSLPGVAANNDYVAQFAVRGASFSRLGIVMDGILLRSPFHAVPSEPASGSLTMLNSDLVEEMTLHSGALPVRFADRTGGAVEFYLREGNRRATTLRASAGVAGVGLLAEGPLGRNATWLAAVRKSFLQYLLRRSAAEDTLAFGFTDVQTKVAWAPRERHQFTVSFLDGFSDLDRTRSRASLGVNAIMLTDYHYTLAGAGWRYTPGANAWIQQRGAWMRERYTALNPTELPLGSGHYGEWVYNVDAAWNWSPRAPLAAGASFRRLRDGGYTARYQFNPFAVRRREEWDGTAWRSGGYLEQGWTRGPLTLTAGSRFDAQSRVAPVAASPHASLLLRLGASSRVQFAWSLAAQYPELQLLTLSRTGNSALPPQRSQHLVAAFEQRLDDRTRLRVEAYQRLDRDLAWQPLLEPRLLANNVIFVPPADPRYEASMRGWARGIEIFLQRRSANRWTGWVSYGYGQTGFRDGVLRAHFPGDFDQRHTVNAYASYRFGPSWSLSTRYSFGSNFPIPGFLRRQGELYFLAQTRNQLRIADYHRADVRLNKTFVRARWRATLYVEVLNLFNRDNIRYDSFNGFNARTGQAFPTFNKLFPIVPAAGVMFEWDAAVR